MSQPSGKSLRFYADEMNQVTLLCPRCSKSKSINASPFREAKQFLRIRCSCGEVFEAAIDFRKCYRKKVRLGGEYRNRRSGENGELLVENLSIDGIGFDPIKPHGLLSGDIVNVEFTLDDPRRSKVRRTVVVRTVRGSFVGSEFAPGQPNNRDLNFYLLPLA
jgi:hypothetical protein